MRFKLTTRGLAVASLGLLASPSTNAEAEAGKAPGESRPHKGRLDDMGETQMPSRAQRDEMLDLAREFATRCESTMEKWLAKNETTESQLFSFLYYPIANTDPTKFNTDWDRLADRDIRPIEDDILSKSATIVFTVLVDKNGYLPAHNTKYSQPLTGNLAVDLVNNRSKRIFADKTGIAAARSTQDYLLQEYLRDTGEKMVDLSVPINIQGKKWGAVRIGYRAISE